MTLTNYHKAVLNPKENIARIPGDNRTDITLGKIRMKVQQYSTNAEDKCFRINFNDIYNPVYQNYPSSTGDNFTADYNLGSPVSTLEVRHYRIVSGYAKAYETCSEFYA